MCTIAKIVIHRLKDSVNKALSNSGGSNATKYLYTIETFFCLVLISFDVIPWSVIALTLVESYAHSSTLVCECHYNDIHFNYATTSHVSIPAKACAYPALSAKP